MISPNGTCKGTLSTIEQGRQTIQFNPKDTCEPGPWNTENLIWDTDLPSSYEAQDFPSVIWVEGNNKDGYPINTIVPAKNEAGKFPKHYSVDCQENYIGNNPRDDGDSRPLQCKILNTYAENNNGAMPNTVGVRYYHVCGSQGNSCQDQETIKSTKSTEWGIYNPVEELCDVLCNGGARESCCVGSPCGFGSNDKIDEEGLGLRQCILTHGKNCYSSLAQDKSRIGRCVPANCHRGCLNPVGGSQGGRLPQGEGSASKSGGGRYQDPMCPPLGVCSCYYNMPCNGKAPWAQRERLTSSCNGLREGNHCAFTHSYDCGLDNGNTSTIETDYSGTCQHPNGGACSVPSTCIQPITGYDAYGNVKQDCVLWGPSRIDVCDIGFTGGCSKPSGGCGPRHLGDMSGEQATSRELTCNNCDSSTTCCPGDSYVNNSNCVCDSSITCCPGDTLISNPNCSI